MAQSADQSSREPTGPLIANVITLLGFVILFTVFATDHVMSLVVGGILILFGALWAGFDDHPADATVEGGGGGRH